MKLGGLNSIGKKMNPKGLIYSFVAKGTMVLAEHTAYSGNFTIVEVQCLLKLLSNGIKYTYSCDDYTFNFLLDSGFVLLVVADESMGRSVPSVFLERVKDDFKQRYGISNEPDRTHPLGSSFHTYDFVNCFVFIAQDPMVQTLQGMEQTKLQVEITHARLAHELKYGTTSKGVTGEPSKRGRCHFPEQSPEKTEAQDSIDRMPKGIPCS